MKINLSIIIKENVKYIIAGIYILPGSDNEIYQDVTMYFDDILESYLDHNFICLGGFNLAKVNWIKNGNKTEVLFHSDTNNQIKKSNNYLAEYINQNELSQMNIFRNHTGNILDLIITKCKKCKVLTPLEKLTKVDIAHPVLQVEVDIEDVLVNKKEYMINPNFVKYDFYNANYDLINKELNKINWKEAFKNKEMDETMDTYYFSLNNIIDKCCKSKVMKYSMYLWWYSKYLKHLLISKKKSHKEYKLSTKEKEELHNNFDVKRKLCKEKLKIDYKMYIKKIEESIEKGTKHFWLHMNKKRKYNEFPKLMQYKEKKQ